MHNWALNFYSLFLRIDTPDMGGKAEKESVKNGN